MKYLQIQLQSNDKELFIIVKTNEQAQKWMKNSHNT